MHALVTALVTTVTGLAVAAGACTPSPRDHRAPSKDGSGQAETAPRKAPVLRPVHAALNVDLDQLAGGTFTPTAYVIGVDGTASVELPGPAPGKIAHVTADGKTTVVEGRLVADAPLRFVRAGDGVRAESFDGRIAYTAHERVTAAAAWSAAPPTGADCCGWWERTLWRAAPRALDAGLLRVVTPANQAWSVLDFHQAGAAEPRWRVLMTGGKGAAVAAAVAPRAEQLVVVVAMPDGSASLQARSVSNGAVAWSTALGSPMSDWRRGEGRVVYSQDGARIAVLVEDPKHCEACSAIEIFDAARGEHVQRVALETVIAPRFSTIGLSGDTAWVFEHVPRSSNELAKRPERCQYEAQDLAGHKRRAAPPADWGLADCAMWAMAPRFDAPGVVVLGQRGRGLAWLVADAAP